jgi:hypothetical protein
MGEERLVALLQESLAAATRTGAAKPAALPTCRIRSTGSSEMMVKATAPLEARTPRNEIPRRLDGIGGSV